MTDVGTAPVQPAREAVILTPVSTMPTVDAVVTVCEGLVGAHVGLYYLVDDAGARRHLHLAWHFSLKNDDKPDADALWVAPRLDEIALADVRRSAHLIARRHEDGRIPYAFQKGASCFSATGVLELNGSLGLTCATFLDLVFAHANVSLLDVSTWDNDRSPERRVADQNAQRRLVEYLRKTHGAAQHAELVEREIPCMRIRAEEVAAASGMTGHPIPFLSAEPEGARILAALQTPREPEKPSAPRVPSLPETKRREVDASSVESAPDA